MVLELTDPFTGEAQGKHVANVNIADLEHKITAVEKQLHAALGATHKADANGGIKMVRVPLVHQISNYVESTRKRVKNIEDMEGTTKCALFL
jgi:hypothetical protein